MVELVRAPRERGTTARAFARAGLMGNPSDAYGGKALAVELRELWAEVTIVPHDRVELRPGPEDAWTFATLSDLAEHARRHGYHGGLRLMSAAAKAFQDHCASRGIGLETRGFLMSYRSSIPRQVGLAGSSAIVVAALRALFRHFGVTEDPHTLPTLALRVETEELGIPAGLMDRVVQVWGGLVVMDLSDGAMADVDGYRCGRYESLDPALLPRLYVAYGTRHAEPTEAVHGPLSERFRNGDPEVRACMAQLASLVDEAVTALRERDPRTLADLMNRNYALRRSVCEVAPDHALMVDRARAAGAPAKFAGSGGAIVGVIPDDAVLARLRREMASLGCEVIVPVPFLDASG